MIDWDKSAELNGMDIEELKVYFDKYPGSSRRIIRICDKCNDDQNVPFSGHSNLCHKCAMSSSKTSAQMSESATERWADQTERDMQSERRIEHFKDQDNRDILSEAKKQYFINHPEAGSEHSRRLIQLHKEHPEIGEAHSEWLIQYYKDNPEVISEFSLMIQEYWNDPKNRAKMSEIKKNSEATKVAIENMCGGNDICEHHYIYDHSDLSKYTMKMTRSHHTWLHWLMRRAGIVVPHINKGD